MLDVCNYENAGAELQSPGPGARTQGWLGEGIGFAGWVTSLILGIKQELHWTTSKLMQYLAIFA